MFYKEHLQQAISTTFQQSKIKGFDLKSPFEFTEGR